jgi:serine/threonine protein kinase
VKLADMGLAREVSDYKVAELEAGRAYGTPYYISPEQIRGEINIDFRADIYSLGATFYHIVVGKVPFEGSTPSTVMHKHLKEPLVPPDHLNTKLFAGVAEVIELMMAKKREERYPSTKELIIDLEAIAGRSTADGPQALRQHVARGHRPFGHHGVLADG